MKQRLLRWLNRPAHWTEFWYPMSGWRGGIILSLAWAVPLYLVFLP